MQKIIALKCPKCNNNHHFHKFGKDKFGNQKYRCLECKHQFAPDYKPTAALPSSISNLFGKKDLKRMRHSPFLIITVLYQFFIGKSSTRNIALMLFQLYNIKLSHVTIADWCKKFAPVFHNISLSLLPMMNFNSDEWHADETVIKINGKKNFVWFIIDSETHFVLGFHLSPHRNSPQANSLLSYAANMRAPSAIFSDRYYVYNVPVKSFFPNAKHIRVQSFQDDITNNIIESFNNRFKAWYKTKRGFHSFHSANATISVFVFFFYFIRPHQGLNGLTPAQVAGAVYKPNHRNLFSLAFS